MPTRRWAESLWAFVVMELFLRSRERAAEQQRFDREFDLIVSGYDAGT